MNLEMYVEPYIIPCDTKNLVEKHQIFRAVLSNSVSPYHEYGSALSNFAAMCFNGERECCFLPLAVKKEPILLLGKLML